MFGLRLPCDAKFLDVQIQFGKPVAWFLVDDSQPYVFTYFGLGTTGNEIAPSTARKKYLGTFMMGNDNLVFHLFGDVEKC
jgi:hypothetical protein